MNKTFKPRVLIPFAIFILLVIFLWWGLTLDPRKLTSTLIGKPVPEFSLATVENLQQKMTSADFVGQVSMLNVWATWCVACEVEHAVLLDIAKDKNMAIYGLDYKDNRDKALAWLHHYGNPYRLIGFDEEGTVAINFGVYGTPETFIIDKHGVIREKYIGPITLDVWNRQLKPLILTLQHES